MNKITTIGLDTAKNIFHVVGCDRHGRIQLRRTLKRQQLMTFFSNLPTCTVGLEACSGSHHWATALLSAGHDAKLIPAQYVKPFVRGNKNDYNDALAIAEAVRCGQMRFVSVKTTEQLDVQSLIRLRQQHIKTRTMQVNQIRGLLAEYGIVLPCGVSQLRKKIPSLLEDAQNGLSVLFRRCLQLAYESLLSMDTQISECDQLLQQHVRQNTVYPRLLSIPGFGPIVASVFYAHVGDGSEYRCGRGVAASIGLVPKQHSSGGQSQLLGISKRGNHYLRYLLVHGARAVVRQIQRQNKTDALSCWVSQLIEQRGYHKAVVALANKLARIGWAVIRHQVDYHYHTNMRMS